LDYGLFYDEYGNEYYHHAVPSFFRFTARSAEWVFERPEIGENLYTRLPGFSTTWMTGEADLTGTNSWYWYYWLSNTQNLAICCSTDGSNAELVTASPYPNAQNFIMFYYQNHHY
jgi:hypothetical protein